MATIKGGGVEIDFIGNLASLREAEVKAEAELKAFDRRRLTEAEKAAKAEAKARLDAVRSEIREQDGLRKAAQSAANQEQERMLKASLAAQKAADREMVASRKKALSDMNAASEAQSKKLEKSLEASVKAEQKLVTQAEQLRSSYDSLYAAELRMNKEIRVANELKARGKLTTEQETEAIRRATAQYEKFQRSQTKGGGLQQHQLTNLSFQANDVISGLLSGQGVGQIAAQQGGQIFQILQQGNGGVMGSLKSLGSIITPLRVGFGLLGVAVGISAAAMMNHDKANKTAELSLIGLGKSSGLTSREILNLSDETAKSAEISIAAARDQTNAYLRMGITNTAVIKGMAAVTKDYSILTGKDAKEATEALGQALKDPAKGAKELNDQFGFLTATQLRNIEVLVEQGDKTKAQTELMRLFGASIADSSNHLTNWDMLWENISRTTSDVFTNLGKILTIDDEMRKRRRADLGSQFGYSPEQAEFDQQDALAGRTAEAKRSGEERRTRGLAAQARGRQLLPNDFRREQIANTRVSIANDLRDGIIFPAQAQKELAALDKELADMDKKTKTRGQSRLETLRRELESIELNIEATWRLTDAYGKGDAEAMRAEANRKGSVDATKKGTDQALRSRLMLNQAIADAALEGTKQYETLNRQVELERQYNDAVIAGTMTREEANSELQLALQLAPLQAAHENATGERQKQIAKIIDQVTTAWRGLRTEREYGRQKAVLEEQANQNKLLEKQLELVRATNRERRVAMAVAQAEAQMEREGKTGTKYAKDYVAGERRRANTEADIEFRNQDQANRNAGISIADQASFGAGVTQADITEQYEAALERIKEIEDERVRAAEGSEEKILKAHRDAEQAKAKVDAEFQEKRLAQVSGFFGGLAILMQSQNKKAKEIGKAAAIVQATIDGYVALNKAWASAPFPYNVPAVITTGAQVFTNVQSIAAMADGGRVSGPGGPREDKIPTMLSNGEFVINAAATSKNLPVLEAINDNRPLPTSVALPQGRTSLATMSQGEGKSSGGGVSLEFHNYGTPQTYEAEQMSEGRIRIIARDEASRVAPQVVAGQINDPNSQVSKSMEKNLQTQRKR